MNKQVKDLEKEIRLKKGAGEVSGTVDYIMYLSIVFVAIFGVMAYKKLQE